MSRAPTTRLLEQGRNALAALQYLERIAVYRAASISLQSAIRAAESGDDQELEDWLLKHRDLLSDEEFRRFSLSISPQILAMDSSNSSVEATAPFFGPDFGGPELRMPKSVEPPGTSSLPFDEADDCRSTPSPWESMETAAQLRQKLIANANDSVSTNSEGAHSSDGLPSCDSGPNTNAVECGGNSFVKAAPDATSCNRVFDSSDADPFPNLSDSTCFHSLEASESHNVRDPFIGIDGGPEASDLGVSPLAMPAILATPTIDMMELEGLPPDACHDEEIEIDEEAASEIEALVPTVTTEVNWREWLEPPVWASVGIHSLAILILSFMVIRHIHEPKATSIVSATYESDRILTQTPMEAPGDLQEDLSDLAVGEELSTHHPLDMVESSTLVGAHLSSLAMDSVVSSTGVGTLSATSSQGLSSDSLSRVVQASATSGITSGTGGNKTVPGAEFFGVKATGNLFIYVVDCSPSMRRENAFEAAKMEIARSLQSMKPSQRYYIYFFAKEIERMEADLGVEEEGPLHATKENITRTMQWLGRTRIQREGWPPNDVLTEAIALEPDGIFLLFDGDTRVDVAKHLTKVNRTSDILRPNQPKSPIHVVHFFADQFANTMRQVAVENGGTYRFIPKSTRSSGRRP